jgi:hypothetical protein
LGQFCKGLKALHALSGQEISPRLTLPQLSAPENSNEIIVIPDLPNRLAEAEQRRAFDHQPWAEIADTIVVHKAASAECL